MSRRDLQCFLLYEQRTKIYSIHMINYKCIQALCFQYGSVVSYWMVEILVVSYGGYSKDICRFDSEDDIRSGDVCSQARN